MIDVLMKECHLLDIAAKTRKLKGHKTHVDIFDHYQL